MHLFYVMRARILWPRAHCCFPMADEETAGSIHYEHEIDNEDSELGPKNLGAVCYYWQKYGFVTMIMAALLCLPFFVILICIYFSGLTLGDSISLFVLPWAVIPALAGLVAILVSLAVFHSLRFCFKTCPSLWKCLAARPCCMGFCRHTCGILPVPPHNYWVYRSRTCALLYLWTCGCMMLVFYALLIGVNVATHWDPFDVNTTQSWVAGPEVRRQPL